VRRLYHIYIYIYIYIWKAYFKSDRLSVKEKCSLVIKNVTEEDAGRYFCQQYNKAEQKQDITEWLLRHCDMAGSCEFCGSWFN
uniref:Immunoglobulin V-set domain-containing protein n=1 Tax=Sander lucioperca TaxID=283035 RepID=A0A8C9XCP8_SANLU